MRALTILLLGSCVALAGPVSADEASVWRLFVADHAEPRVTAIDLPQGEVVGTFDLEGPASLYASRSKHGVYAVQADADRVSVIATGIAIDDHGDHGDLEVSPPRLLETAVEGPRPVHFVEHDGEIALFFDGAGRAEVRREDDLLAGRANFRTYATAAPHHGVAASLGEAVLITEPHPDDASALPIGITVLDPDGNPQGELHACPDQHGEATSGRTLAIACASGLLLVNEGAAGPTIEHLPYAADLPAGKATTLLGGVGMKFWLGNYGADRVVIIDPEDDTPFRLVDLPTRRVHFALDPIRPRLAYVFTEDGDLHRLDVVSGAITGTLTVTEPYSMDGAWNLPRPRIAVADDVIAVTDPRGGRIRLVDAAGFDIVRDLETGGMPYNVVAVGGSGHAH